MPKPIINEVIQETVNEFPEVKLVCKLGEILDNLGLSIRELSLITGIRYATVNELVNNKKVAYHMDHLMPIIIALRIKDVSELFEIVVPEDVSEKYEEESEEYRNHGIPDSVIEKIEPNAEKLGRTKELGNR